MAYRNIEMFASMGLETFVSDAWCWAMFEKQGPRVAIAY